HSDRGGRRRAGERTVVGHEVNRDRGRVDRARVVVGDRAQDLLVLAGRTVATQGQDARATVVAGGDRGAGRVGRQNIARVQRAQSGGQRDQVATVIAGGGRRRIGDG